MVLKRRLFSPQKIAARLDLVKKYGSQNSVAPQTDESTLSALLSAEMELQGLMPWSSNYTFLTSLHAPGQPEILAIYKPADGERPLWDFPERTLSHREFASYLVSQILGWPNIPATVLRQGPHGLGSVQLFIEAEYEAHYFNMRDLPAFTEDFKNMALFDFIVNNADRKGGHCLKGADGTIWAIDHGLTFHTDPKLRTVIWEFSDEPISEARLNDLARLQNLLDNSELCQVLVDVIAPQEIDAFKRRVAALVNSGKFPALRPGRNVPYPPI